MWGYASFCYGALSGARSGSGVMEGIRLRGCFKKGMDRVGRVNKRSFCRGALSCTSRGPGLMTLAVTPGWIWGRVEGSYF